MDTSSPDDKLVKTGLACWGMDEASYCNISVLGDRAFYVQHFEQAYKFRITHSKNSSRDAILSEHELLRVGRGADLPCTRIIKTPLGEKVCEIDDYILDMIEFIKGKVLGSSGKLRKFARPEELFHNIGTTLAQWHSLCDNWNKPDYFTRPILDADGLLGQNAVWGKFWTNTKLNRIQATRFNEFRRSAISVLLNIEKTQNFGLIQGGLSYEKIIINGDRVFFVSWRHCGFGFRLFDLAAILNQLRGDENESELSSAFLQGYQSVIAIDTRQLPLFQAIKACTEIGRISQYQSQQNVQNDLDQRMIKLAEELIWEWQNR